MSDAEGERQRRVGQMTSKPALDRRSGMPETEWHSRCCRNIAISLIDPATEVLSEIACLQHAISVA